MSSAQPRREHERYTPTPKILLVPFTDYRKAGVSEAGSSNGYGIRVWTRDADGKHVHRLAFFYSMREAVSSIRVITSSASTVVSVNRREMEGILEREWDDAVQAKSVNVLSNMRYTESDEYCRIARRRLKNLRDEPRSQKQDGPCEVLIMMGFNEMCIRSATTITQVFISAECDCVSVWNVPQISWKPAHA